MSTIEEDPASRDAADDDDVDAPFKNCGAPVTPLICPPHRPRSSGRRPVSAGPSRGRELVRPRPKRPMSAAKRRIDEAAQEDMAQFLLEHAEKAESRAVRHRLLAFADVERVYADRDRLLRTLAVRDRQTPRQNAEEAHEDIERHRAAASVVQKVRSFYADLRAERAVLHQVTDSLKDEVRESLRDKERAAAAAAAAEAGRAEAVDELRDIKEASRRAVESANQTMEAAATASASACGDAARLRIEIEAMRHELRNSRRAEEEMRRTTDDALHEARLRVESEAARSRELAEYGARLQAKVHGAERRAETTQIRVEVAEERAARLEGVTSINTALSAEVERLKQLFTGTRRSSPKRGGKRGKSKKSPSKKKSSKKGRSKKKFPRGGPKSPKSPRSPRRRR